jgi:hypothetical protein
VTVDKEIKDIINKQISEAIGMAPYIAKMLSNPHLDLTKFALTCEPDFYLGAMWASAIDFIGAKIKKEYHRSPSDEENAIAVQLMMSRVFEFKEAIAKLGL